MGRVKTTFIKRLAQELYRKYPEKFSTEFEKNKAVVDELIAIKSRKIRNTVAGYLVRLKKQQ
jgi:small subunit ribosomal protein S17e